jgi:hypothetical protein
MYSFCIVAIRILTPKIGKTPPMKYPVKRLRAVSVYQGLLNEVWQKKVLYKSCPWELPMGRRILLN